MTSSSQNVCKAQNKFTCPYHNPQGKLLQRAVENEDYAAYEMTRKLAEQRGKEETANSFIHEAEFRNVKKMPALFVIDREKHQATTSVNESAAWIFTEPSRATIKRDGTSITVTGDGKIYARRAVKKGKTAPPDFIAAETDSFTGHTFGVEPVEQSGFNKMFEEALGGETLATGTYELCGPKVNGNPEKLDSHKLIFHGSDEATEIPDMRTIPREQAYETLKTVFAEYKERGIEGVVWWGGNGRRAKLRVKDFVGDSNRS